MEKMKKIGALALVLVLALSLVACGADSDDYSYGGGIYVPPVSPYVKMVRDAKHSTYGITYGTAFNDFFSDPEWSYFESTTGEHVVEFEGGFSYDNSPATARIQFIIDLDEGTFSAAYLAINDVAQNKLMLAALIKKVFESY